MTTTTKSSVWCRVENVVVVDGVDAVGGAGNCADVEVATKAELMMYPQYAVQWRQVRKRARER